MYASIWAVDFGLQAAIERLYVQAYLLTKLTWSVDYEGHFVNDMPVRYSNALVIIKLAIRHRC